MTNLTNNEAIKELRKSARDNGLVFKQSKVSGIWGAYNRETGVKVTEFRNVMHAYHSNLECWFENNNQK